MKHLVTTIIRRSQKIRQYASKHIKKHIEVFLDVTKKKSSYFRIINQSPFTLIITHDLGGGSDLYLQEMLMNTRDAHLIIISHPYGYKLKYVSQKQHLWLLLPSLSALRSKIKLDNITAIFLNNYVRGREPLRLIEFLLYLKQNYQRRLTIPIHDFFSICPSYPLINQKKKFCGVPEDIATCEKCRIRNTYNQYQAISIQTWRQAWQTLLIAADEIKCFSNNSKHLLLKAYPELVKHNVTVTPHRINQIGSPIKLNKSDNLHIGIVGNISCFHKGVSLVKEMLKIITQENLNVHVTIIGSAFQLANNKHLTITGPYKREQLAEIISKSSINVFFLPSVWPETFSYVTHELIRLSLPIAVFNIGAQAEAIKQYENGYIIPDMTAKAALHHLALFSKL